MLIIDAHNHPDWLDCDFDRFVQNMDEHGIAVTWVLSLEGPQDEFDQVVHAAFLDPRGSGVISMLHRCLHYQEKAPDRFVAGYCPDPRRPEALDLMRIAIDVHRVRVCGELKLRMMYDNWDALRLFRYCGERGVPVIFHLDYEFDTGQTYPRPNYWYGGGFEALERVLNACPDTLFLGHGPGFWAHISGDRKYRQVPYPKGKVRPGGRLIKALRKYPNLYCDGSGGSGWNALTRDPEFGREFVLEFQDRYLYARDLFDNRHQEALNAMDLPEEVLRKVYAGNALRLVPLEGYAA